MSIQAVIVLLVGLATIAGVVFYLFKRSSERAAHRTYEQARSERTRALEQCAVREAHGCEAKPEVYQTLGALVGDARESMRERIELLEAGKTVETNTCAIESEAHGCQTHVEAIESLLFEQRAILPPSVFGLMHDVRNRAVAFEAMVRKAIEGPQASARGKELERLREQYESVDRLYASLVDQVQGFFDACACPQ